MCETQGKRSSGKKVLSPTSERLPMKRSIGMRIRSPIAIVHSTMRSHSDFDTLLVSVLAGSSGRHCDRPSAH